MEARESTETFASAADETRTDSNVCPCTNVNNNITDFSTRVDVGDDYFCDTGAPTGTV